MGVKNFIMKRIPFCKMKAKRKYRESHCEVTRNPRRAGRVS